MIRASLVDQKDIDGHALGICFHVHELHAADIKIAKINCEMVSGELIRPCHERVLVHELLHCKRIPMENSDRNIENCSFEVSEHAFIEQMAKALIMAKYGLSFNWFKNF